MMESYHQTHTVHPKSDIFYDIPPPSPSQRYPSSLHQTQNSDFDGALSGHRRASIQSHPGAQPQFYEQQHQYQPQYDNAQFQQQYQPGPTSVDASYTMQQVMHGDVYYQPADPQYYQEDQQQQQMDPYYPHSTQADPNSYAQSHGTFSTVSPLARHVPVDGSQYSDVPAPSTTSAGHFAREPPYTEPSHIATSQVTPTMYYPPDCAPDNAQSNAVMVNQVPYYSAGDMSKGYTQQYYSHSEATVGHEGQQYQHQSVDQFQPHLHHQSSEAVVIQPPISHQNQRYGYTGGSCESAVPANEAQTSYIEPHHPHAPSLSINTDVSSQGPHTSLSSHPSSAYVRSAFVPYTPHSSISVAVPPFFDDGAAYISPDDDWSSGYPNLVVPGSAVESPSNALPVAYGTMDTRADQVPSTGSYSSSSLTRSSTMPRSHEHQYGYEEHDDEPQALARQNTYASHEHSHTASHAMTALAHPQPHQDVKLEGQESFAQEQPLPEPHQLTSETSPQMTDVPLRESRRSSLHATEESLAPPPFIVRSSSRPSSVVVAVAAGLNVPVPPSDITAPTSHEARVMRRKSASMAAQHYSPYGQEKSQRDVSKKNRKSQRPSISESSSSSSSSTYPSEPSASSSSSGQPATSQAKYEPPQVITIAERPHITMPPFHSSPAGSPISGGGGVMTQSAGPFIAHEFHKNGSHQIIKFSSPEAEGSSCGAGEKHSSGSGSKGKAAAVAAAANANGTSRNGYMDANGDKKPFLACRFCRQRKIACGPGPLAESPDPSIPIGPRTCNQCFRRGIDCEYPSESRRGLRKVHEEDENDKGEGTSASASSSSKKKKPAKPRPPIEMIKAADHDLVVDMRPSR